FEIRVTTRTAVQPSVVSDPGGVQAWRDPRSDNVRTRIRAVPAAGPEHHLRAEWITWKPCRIAFDHAHRPALQRARHPAGTIPEQEPVRTDRKFERPADAEVVRGRGPIDDVVVIRT